MRLIVAALLGSFLLSSCSEPAPPVGRWEGTYKSGATYIAARLELAPGPTARISASDVTDQSITNDEDRIAMEQNLAERLAGSWGEVVPRPLAVDGQTFRKPGGSAPLITWNPAANMMTLYVYLDTQIAIRVTLRRVTDFSANPWSHRTAHLANEKYAAATRHAKAATWFQRNASPR